MYTRRQVRRPKVSDDKKSKRRKERERERGKKNNLGINVFQCPFEKLRVCVCGGFVFLNGYQKRCPLFRSSVSHGLGEAQKSSVFVKREFGRKHLSVLCNSPRSFSSCPLPWTPERQHLGGSRTLRRRAGGGGVGWWWWRGGDHCHLFTCYAGRSSLCVPWASRWQRAVGRRCPPLRCWSQALGCTGGCRSPA